MGSPSGSGTARAAPDVADPSREAQGSWSGAWDLSYVLLPALLCFAVPAAVVSNNRQSFALLSPVTFAYLVALGVALHVFLRAVGGAVSTPWVTRAFVGLCRLAVYSMLWSGFFLPLCESSALLSPRHIPSNPVNVAIVSALSLAMLWVSRTRVGKNLDLAVAAFVTLNASLAVYTVATVGRPAHDPDAAFGVSPERNVFVLSFDGIPGPAALEVLERDPELAERFRGFQLYTETLSSAASTAPSLLGTALGNDNHRDRFGTVEELAEVRREDLITHRLASAGFRVAAYGPEPLWFADERGAIVRGGLSRELVVEPLEVLNYGLVRTFTRFAVIRGDAADWLSAQVRRLHPSQLPEVAHRIEATRHADRHYDRDVLDFDIWVEGLTTAGPEPVAQLHHFTHTHFNVDFDRDCRFRGDDEAWYRSHQTPEAVVDETHCVLRQAGRFLDRIEALGVLERSLVVIKSDHGKPRSFQDPTRVEGYALGDHEKWGYGRYVVFLAIKDFGPATAPPVRRPQLTMLGDLAKTLCEHAGPAMDCSDYRGPDLLAGEWVPADHDPTFMTIPAGPDSSWKFRTHRTLKMRRGTTALGTIHAAVMEEVLAEQPACDTELVVEHAGAFQNGRSDRRSWAVLRDGASTTVEWRRGAGCTRLVLRIGAPPEGLSGHTLWLDGRALDAPLRDAVASAGDAAASRVEVALDGGTPGALHRLELRAGDGPGAAPLTVTSLRFERPN